MIAGSLNSYRLHVKALLQLPHDIIDILFEVRPSVEISSIPVDRELRMFAHVASRSSRSRADGGIVAAKEGVRDIGTVSFVPKRDRRTGGRDWAQRAIAIFTQRGRCVGKLCERDEEVNQSLSGSSISERLVRSVGVKRRSVKLEISPGCSKRAFPKST